MSAKDDVEADLRDAYDQLTRQDIEAVVQMLDQAPAGHAGLSVSVALKPSFPAAASRLEDYSDADRTEYMRLLKGAAVVVLRQWDATGERPDSTQVISSLEEIEGGS